MVFGWKENLEFNEMLETFGDQHVHLLVSEFIFQGEANLQTELTN